jgi:Domain of unknown function (DUF6602)
VANARVIDRLAAIQSILIAAHKGGGGLASALIGGERESFINLVLSNVIAPPFRIGTGEITDHSGKLCGQADIVIEYSNSMSFPLLQGNQSRLYLAESVCCVIEVKSNLSAQWSEVVKKAKKLAKVRRDTGCVAAADPLPPDDIPIFAVGYTGWTTEKMCKDKVNDAGLSGLLVLDAGIYVGGKGYEDATMSGPRSIFGFLLSIEQLTSSFIGAKPSLKPYVV